MLRDAPPPFREVGESNDACKYARTFLLPPRASSIVETIVPASQDVVHARYIYVALCHSEKYTIRLTLRVT